MATSAHGIPRRSYHLHQDSGNKFCYHTSSAVPLHWSHGSAWVKNQSLFLLIAYSFLLILLLMGILSRRWRETF
ncbi:unnamed protein product [Urochloa humidicola]